MIWLKIIKQTNINKTSDEMEMICDRTRNENG